MKLIWVTDCNPVDFMGLEGTEPHFIRCIKPNTSQLPNIFEQELVLQQLRCCGVLEVVRISRSGYPTRHSHQEFASR
jgi:myosin-5